MISTVNCKSFFHDQFHETRLTRLEKNRECLGSGIKEKAAAATQFSMSEMLWKLTCWHQQTNSGHFF